MAAGALVRRGAEDHYAVATTKNTFDGRYSRDSVIATLAIALGLYNSLEMILLISTTFKRRKGLYYWSLTLNNAGVIFYCLGMLLSYFQLGPRIFYYIILDVGWIMIIVFQSLVLYSRLFLIVDNQKITQGVKWMIILDSLLLCTMTITLEFGSGYTDLKGFAEGYYYIEQIQVTWFTVQEFIISGIYVWKTIALLKIISSKSARIMIWQLFIINVIIISMDIALICMQFLHYQLYQEVLKGFVYSVKLKLELNILSKLVDLVQDNKSNRSMTLDAIDSNTIAGQAREDVKQELATEQNLRRWPGSDEKLGSQHVEEIGDSLRERASSSVASQPVDDIEGISRVFSNQSRITNRTAGRESDILYADMLYSMK